MFYTVHTYICSTLYIATAVKCPKTDGSNLTTVGVGHRFNGGRGNGNLTTGACNATHNGFTVTYGCFCYT